MATLDEYRAAFPISGLSKWAWAIILGANGLTWILAALVAAFWGPASPGYVLPAVVIAAQIGVFLCIPGVKAVVRHTFSQCLRMKIAAAFIFLLAVALAVTSTQMKGDGTLAGQVRTFLKYSTGITSFLLSVVTVFLAAGLISHDVRDKTVFSVAVKPLPRWQYVVGRWLGLVLFDAVLLGISAAIIYGVSQYLRYQTQIGTQVIDPRDRAAAENEVFASRNKVSPVPFEIEAQVRDRYRIMREAGRLDSALEDYRARSQALTEAGKAEDARKALDVEIRKQVLAPLQSAEPFPEGAPIPVEGGIVPLEARDWPTVLALWDQGMLSRQELKWQFEGISLVGAEVRGTGRVLAGRAANLRNSTVAIQFECPSQLVSHLINTGPVRVNSLDGTVLPPGPDRFWAEFNFNDQTRNEINSLVEGAEVRIVIPPTVQVSFKGTPLGAGDDDTIRGLWIAENPENPRYKYPIFRDDPSRAQSTLTFPARAVDSKGRMTVHFVNRGRSTVEIKPQDVAVMYREGGFEWNFIRGMMLVMVQLMYIAGLAVLASSFLSFAMACIVSFSLMPFTLMQGWFRDMFNTAGLTGSFVDQIIHLGRSLRCVFSDQLELNLSFPMHLAYFVLRGMSALFPDFSATSPGDAFVGGMTISWGQLGETAVVQLAIRTLLLLGFACWIFRRRELARVQV
ncbi:MAG: ABC transporter permease [Phycisphaerae bacterium]